MWILVVLLIMVSVYVIKNEKVPEEYRNGWLAIAGVFLVLWIILSIIF